MHMIYKTCPRCGRQWQTREAWLRDPQVTLVGYQVNFNDLKAGILLFNHDCRTTLAVKAEEFTDLYQGPMFVQRATGTDACPGHCLHRDNLGPCPAQCECVYIRNVLQQIKDWPKDEAADRQRPST